MHLLK